MKTRYIALFLVLLVTACSAPPDLQPEDIDMSRRFLDDDFESKAARRRPTKPIPKVQTISSSSGIWTNNNNFGQSVILNNVVGERTSVIKRPEFGPPKVHTVHLGLEFVDDGTSIGFLVKASVNLGCGGTITQFDMDWHNGASFSAVFSSIEVVAYYESRFGTSLPDSPVKLSAIVGEGGGYFGKPTLTGLYIETVGGGSSTSDVSIPQFAQRLRVLGFGTDAATTQVFFEDNNGNTILVVPGGSLELLSFQGIPIPNGARKVHAVNNSGGSLNYTFEFVLDI